MAVAAATAAGPPADGDIQVQIPSVCLIEDGLDWNENAGVQPCKKRKEDDPSIKAITKYFLPLGKSVHRMASPPKPNNIMDYLKKTSPTNEKIISPVTEKESKTTSLPLENSSKSSSKLKRRGKRCNLTNTLKDGKTLNVVIEIDSNDSREILSPEEKDSETNSIRPSLPALLGPTNAEETVKACSKNPLAIVNFKNQEGKIRMAGDTIKTNVKSSKKRKHKDESNLCESFLPETQQKDLYKAVNDKPVASISECENESLVNIQDHDTSAHETPPLNDNIVTVSFEDFLKSQEENKVDHIPKAQTSDNSIACDETDICQDVEELPLKKVTVLAQIHSIPPKSPSSQKIASIFLKRKNKEAKRQSSPSASEGEGTDQTTLKRKSNVVIAEEELELAVLEASSSEAVKSKCTAEERYQFMKAFKQPESETVRTGAKKGPGKQKEVGGKSSKHKLEMEECEDVSNKKLENEVSAVNTNSSSHDKDSTNDNNKVRTSKLKRKKQIQKTKVLNLNRNQKSEVNDQIKAGTSLEAQSKLPQKNNELRRSLRQKKGKDSIHCTPEKAEIAKTVTKNTPPAIPLQASTPKTSNKMFSKSDLYKAEMITEPFDSKSPIRMKFTRISIAERFKQQSIKVNTTSNNISKAKKLVEKAKVLQHHRQTRNVEDTLHIPLRRSCRQQAIADRKRSQNMEESVITLDSCTGTVTTVVRSVDKQKKCQNLNDVLRGEGGHVKATKKKNGKEKFSFLVRKKINKLTDDEAITTLDESSEDGSENSQDDKQCRAKREFLMSGLPESLKRQMAKKAAALEVYSSANCCFRTVVHVQQKDVGCLMWRLALPSCPLLTNLREVNLDVTDVAKLTFSLGEFSILSAQPHSTDSPIAALSGWRPAFSDAQKNCLLEEIQSFNTHFPVKHFFDLIMKKQAALENNKQVNKCEAVNSEISRKTGNQREAKRKRRAEDHKSKRRKPVEKAETDVPTKVSKVSNVKQAGLENSIRTVDANVTEESEIRTMQDSELGSEISPAPDFTHEDILWTEKYQPQNSSELVGNTIAIKKLHRWLCEWKRRADWEENRTEKEEESDSQQESSDSADFQDDRSDSEDETVLCNTMLLIGPPGIGKTAAVYACAQELGFKIFEVNASCQRSGRQILSHLKEATQSHQVDKKGVHAHKPSFFNSYSTSQSPKKSSPRKEWSPRKSSVSPRKVGLKQGLAPKTLANYFKIASRPQNKEEKAQGNNKENKEILSGENTQRKPVKREIKEEESSKKCATSLILFEEVDIIFDEDVGFLNAIKTFMTTTKRPVILTTNDPSFSLIFDGCFEEITFSAPSLINVASYLQVLCLAENLRTDIKDFAALLTSNNCDIRQSILHLQFWVKSGGGYLKGKRMALHGQEKEASGTQQGTCLKDPATTETRNPEPLVKIPKCDAGCIENLLGLTNIFLPSEDLFSFLKHKITTKEEWNKLIHLLTEFQRKDIDFIYSNLENILPLPFNILSEPMHVPNLLCQNFTKISSNNGLIESDCLGKTSPVKKSKKKKCRRRMAVLDDSDLFESELNYSGFITVPSDTTSTCLKEKPECNSTGLNDETTAKAKGCALTFQYLNSLTEFVDNMSLSDCCFSWRTQESRQSCKYEEFIWTKGKIKNGLSDEFSVEDTDWWSFQSAIELKATMEALNFNKCFKSISKIMENALNTARTPGKNEFEEVPLHISKDQPNLYFGQPAANSRIHHNAQKRLELIETVFSGSTPLNFSNRQASVTEYLPTLRNICKSEKQKEQGKTKRRFLHYLEGIHLPKEILNSLATDFP